MYEMQSGQSKSTVTRGICATLFRGQYSNLLQPVKCSTCFSAPLSLCLYILVPLCISLSGRLNKHQAVIMLVSPVTFNRLVLSSSRTETPPLALDNYSLNKKKCEFMVSATPSRGGGGGGGNLWRRKRQQRRNEDNAIGYGSDSEETEKTASGVVGHAVLAKIRGADKKENVTTPLKTAAPETTRTAKWKKASTTSLNGSDVLMALLNSSSKSNIKKRRKGRSTSFTRRGDDYTSSSEEEDEENNSLMSRPLHIKKEWGSKLDELGRSLEELVMLHDSR